MTEASRLKMLYMLYFFTINLHNIVIKKLKHSYTESQSHIELTVGDL